MPQEAKPEASLPEDRNSREKPGILEELTHHLPYTVFSVLLSLGLLALLTSLGHLQASRNLFHFFHPAHLFLSATATTAMFRVHDARIGKALLVGLSGSVLFCSLSDIILPLLGGKLLRQSLHLHICIIEDPGIVIPFVAVGIALGLMAGAHVHRSTIYSHAGHVLVSSLASLFYLTGFGLEEWIDQIGWILLIITVAVAVPCCLSDIVYPLLFAGKKVCRHDTSGGR